jgi:hypothetical protein
VLNGAGDPGDSDPDESDDGYRPLDLLRGPPRGPPRGPSRGPLGNEGDDDEDLPRLKGNKDRLV